MKKSLILHFGLSFLVIQIFLILRSVRGQFYIIYPAAEIVPNSLPLNSSIIQLGAFLALTALDGEVKISRSSLDVICIECQREIINNDPNLLPNMNIEVLYYDTSVLNTSKASISALEYSLTSNHIATFGKNIVSIYSKIFFRTRFI